MRVEVFERACFGFIIAGSNHTFFLSFSALLNAVHLATALLSDVME